MRFVQPVGDTRGEEDAPEAVAWVGVVVAGMPRPQRGVIPAEDELEVRFEEIHSHRHSLPTRLLRHLKSKKVIQVSLLDIIEEVLTLGSETASQAWLWSEVY